MDNLGLKKDSVWQVGRSLGKGEGIAVAATLKSVALFAFDRNTRCHVSLVAAVWPANLARTGTVSVTRAHGGTCNSNEEKKTDSCSYHAVFNVIV